MKNLILFFSLSLSVYFYPILLNKNRAKIFNNAVTIKISKKAKVFHVDIVTLATKKLWSQKVPTCVHETRTHNN